MTDGTTELTDEQVVERVLAGEVRLFEVVMRRYNQRLFRAARAIVKDDAEAEDVMQEAWVRAYAHLAEFEGRARFSTWLLRIGIHEALARVRKSRRQEPFDDSEETDVMTSNAEDPEKKASDHEMRGVLETAIDSLPLNFRTVFVMREIEEMSVADTAACLGIPEETVKTRAFRARALLRDALLERTLTSAAPRAFGFLGARCDRVVTRVMSRIESGELGAGSDVDSGARSS